MATPARSEAVALINRQFERETPAADAKHSKHYYGVQELRELLDFIYGGPPAGDREELVGHPMNGKRH